AGAGPGSYGDPPISAVILRPRDKARPESPDRGAGLLPPQRLWRRRSVRVGTAHPRSVHRAVTVALGVFLVVVVRAGGAIDQDPAGHVLGVVWLDLEVPREGVVVHAIFPLTVTE